MKPFFTITSKNTTHTNSRSHRFDKFEDAQAAAVGRIARGEAEGDAVFILKAVALVEPIQPKCTTTMLSDNEASS
jgi:hypothetical protein